MPRNPYPLFGDFADAVAHLAKANPDLREFLQSPLPETRHYVALALTGLNVTSPTSQSKGDAAVEAFARALPSLPRRTVLTQVWQKDLGSTRILKRLGATVLPHESYRQLAIIMSDTTRREALLLAKPVTAATLARLATVKVDALSYFSPSLIGAFGEVGTRFLLDGLKRTRPDLAEADLLRQLNAVERPFRLNSLMKRLTRDMPLPRHPWLGNVDVRPLTTVPDLKAAGRRLQNCMTDVEIWIEALGGSRAFYLVEGEELCAAALAKHPLFGTWYLQAIRRRRNANPSCGRLAWIASMFEEAGFPFMAPDADISLGVL